MLIHFTNITYIKFLFLSRNFKIYSRNIFVKRENYLRVNCMLRNAGLIIMYYYLELSVSFSISFFLFISVPSKNCDSDIIFMVFVFKIYNVFEITQFLFALQTTFLLFYTNSFKRNFCCRLLYRINR